MPQEQKYKTMRETQQECNTTRFRFRYMFISNSYGTEFVT